jgi:hypothetical protein
MLSFSKFLTESTRILTKNGLEDAIASYKKDGEILNPEFINLKNDASRIFGKDENAVRDEILKIMHRSDRDNRDPHLNDIYYDLPHDSLRGLGKLQKTILKVEKDNPNQDTLKIIQSCNTLIHNWKGIAADIVMLKDKVVKVTQKREEAKAVKAKEIQSQFADSSSLIKIFESHMEEYKAMAAKRATEFVNMKLKELEKHGWDLNKVAPAPKSSYGGTAYKTAQQVRSLYLNFTKSKNEGSYRLPGTEDIRVKDKQAIDRYIKASVDGAEVSYRKFMHKMITKIGKPVVHAEMIGNIWTNAILTVKTNDGESQRWKTKMIINFSRYNLMFNQFPTTKLK